MDFNKVSKTVTAYLRLVSLDERIRIFNDVFKFNIEKHDGSYFLHGKEYSESEMKDYLEIEIYWLSMKNMDRLYEYILNNFERQ